MKKLFKYALLIAMGVATLSFNISAAEADIPDEHLKEIVEPKSEAISVLCFGNSILIHGPSSDVGWTGNWGMAASTEQNDYYYSIQRMIEYEDYDNITWSRSSVAPLERAIDERLDYDYASEIKAYLAPSIAKAQPDVIIFQIGENVSSAPTRESYAHALTKFAEYCMSVNPEVQIIFCMPFWGGDAKCAGVMDAAKKLGFTYANLAQLNLPEYKAIGKFTHSGVAEHPGDAGMAKIAELLFEQLCIVLEKKYVNPEQVQVKLDGQFLSFDVPAQIVNGRTMIPVRKVSEAFDADVKWIDEEKKAVITTATSTIEIVQGDMFLTKDGTKIELDVPATNIDGRVMIPLRAVASALDCKVDWDPVRRFALIEKPVLESGTDIVSE